MAETFNEIIGENIKRIRKSRGLSKNQLAYKIGCKNSSIRYWELGKFAPSAYYLLRLSKVFNCSIDELFKQKGDSNE